MATTKLKISALTSLSALMLLMGSAHAAGNTATRGDTTINAPSESRASGNEAQDTARQVTEAAQVINRMERDAGATRLLQQARGVFIIPDFGRAALVAGVRGGEGVVLTKQGSRWSNPAFYNIGGVSLGAQAGAEGGSLVLVLNNDKAVRSLMQNNNWSLNAESGLTIVNWSGKAQSSTGKGDVTVWSDTEGLLAGLQLSLTDISFDRDETAAYYGRQVVARDIFNGRVSAPAQASVLRQALGQAAGSTSAGGPATGESAGGPGSASQSGSERNMDGKR